MEKVLTQLLNSVPADVRAEFSAKLQRCTCGADILAICQTYHLSASEEAAAAAAAYLAKPVLISEEELSAVDGGSFFPTDSCPGDTDRCSGGA